MGVIRRLLALIVLICAATLVAVAAYVYLYERPAELPAGANIVVLSAGLDGNQMNAETAERTATGIALYNDLVARGETPMIVMTGGRPSPDLPAHATLMSDAARAAGVPIPDIRVEPEAKSTLQNALFSQPLLAEAADGPLILVTHRYHLPRAWASFRWAGMSDLTLYSAEPEDTPPAIQGLILEAVKWPGNALRAGAYSGLTAAGMDADTLVSFLQ